MKDIGWTMPYTFLQLSNHSEVFGKITDIVVGYTDGDGDYYFFVLEKDQTATIVYVNAIFTELFTNSHQVVNRGM